MRTTLSLHGLTEQQTETLIHLRDWFLNYNAEEERQQMAAFSAALDRRFLNAGPGFD